MVLEVGILSEGGIDPKLRLIEASLDPKLFLIEASLKFGKHDQKYDQSKSCKSGAHKEVTPSACNRCLKTRVGRQASYKI